MNDFGTLTWVKKMDDCGYGVIIKENMGVYGDTAGPNLPLRSERRERMLTQKAIAGILGQAELFRGLDEPGRFAVAVECVQRDLARRQYLFHEGTAADAVYILFSGSVQLIKSGDSGRDVVIRTIKPGEIFAEAVLFERDNYPVSAVALKKSTLIRLGRNEFFRLLDERNFRNRFLASLMGRLKYLTNLVFRISAYDVETRFCLFLMEQYGRKEEYILQISKKDIAAAIGATPETLSRLVLRMKKRGMTWKGKTIRLKKGFWEKFVVK